jgi:hypothetical protein
MALTIFAAVKRTFTSPWKSSFFANTCAARNGTRLLTVVNMLISFLFRGKENYIDSDLIARAAKKLPPLNQPLGLVC